MSKIIKRFYERSYGLFIDLADAAPSVSINPKSGEILLFEGGGDDRYHGAMISANDCRGLTLEPNQDGGWDVMLHFGEDNSHSLGNTGDEAAAQDWIDKAWAVIRAKQSPDILNAALLVKEDAPAYAAG